MEVTNMILGIIASIASILATFFSFLNHREIQKLTNKNSNNKQRAKGNENVLMNGDNNKVGR
ncbi:hypothetical protein [Lactococcus garvieae]|uniref:hypothetical protein n=1 Tax=Lactococcus garvieae TaxID=1363 RepID=UPI0022E67903|nr:hypothetical protein [Lactococcus garvieae]